MNKRAWLREVLRLLGLQLVAWELAENLKSAPPRRKATQMTHDCRK